MYNMDNKLNADIIQDKGRDPVNYTVIESKNNKKPLLPLSMVALIQKKASCSSFISMTRGKSHKNMVAICRSACLT